MALIMALAFALYEWKGRLVSGECLGKPFQRQCLRNHQSKVVGGVCVRIHA
jgi:hypothetical protein